MTLTEREVEVLRLLKEGKTQAQIAKTLKITQPAVSAFKRNAEYKIRDASELIKRAKELGLLLIAFAFFFSWTPDAFAVTPNPGHAAYTVGPGMNGSFYNGNYTFPNNLNVTQNLTVVGTTNLTGTTYLGRAYINGSIGPGVNGALNVVGSVFVETSGGYNGISIGAPWYQGIWRSASSGATIISGPSGPGVKLIYNNDENSVLANFNTSMMSIENLDINFSRNARNYLYSNLGRVGINNTAPAFTLDVAGTANISSVLYTSQLCLNGSCQTSWPSGSGNITGGGTANYSVRWTNGSNIGAGTILDNGSTIAFPNGSIAIPSITFIGDTNTGIYRPAEDTIHITTGGIATSEGGMYIFPPDGNEFTPVAFGLGSNNGVPLTLHTGQSDSTVQELFRLVRRDRSSPGANGIGSSMRWHLEDAGSSIGLSAAIDVILDDATAASKDSSMRFYTVGPNSATFSTVERMIIDSNGRIGVNTSSPNSTLHVVGSANITSIIYTPQICLNGDCRTGWPVSGTGNISGGEGTVNGNLAFFNNATMVNGTTNLFWDNVNSRLSIAGDNTPAEALTVGASDAFRVTSAGYTYMPAGINTTPSLSFVSDTDTGMYSGGPNILRFTTGGTNRLIIHSDGRTLTPDGLSIGTTSATDGNAGRLRIINSDTNFALTITRADPSASAAAIGLYTNTNARWLLGMRSSDTTDNLHIYSYSKSSNLVTISNATGYVGINTSTPTANLDVGGNISISGTEVFTSSRVLYTPQICLNGDCKTAWNVTTGAGTVNGYIALWNNGSVINGTSTLRLIENNTFAIYNDTGGHLARFNGTNNAVILGNTNNNITLRVHGTINASSSVTSNGGFDFAEMFSALEPMERGDLVIATDENSVRKATRADADLVIGAVSDEPGFILSNSGLANPTFIGLAGRIPVKITGPIQRGDFITISSTPGVGMAAREPSFVIGRAISDVRADNTVMMIIQPTYFSPQVDANNELLGGKRGKVFEAGLSVRENGQTSSTTPPGQARGQDRVVELGATDDVVVRLG